MNQRARKARTISVVAACLWLTIYRSLVCAAPQDSLPHLRRQGSATQLIVDGKPFLVLGGELGNSTSSSLEYMQSVWPRLVALNLNTVLVPVYWELIEPTEGKFDFTIVDGLIQAARRHHLRLVPLWFASWKNSMSCYAPAWVKTDQRRFPRSQDAAGHGMEILSAFSSENVEADARAFAAFMHHLRDLDNSDHTVIMVQVENEIGMIPDSRDRSAMAEKQFHQSVPNELLAYLEQHRDKLMPELRARWESNGSKTRGNWEEVFGTGAATDEIFTAWYFARYVDQVAQRAAREYKLPMYVNAALIRPGYQPGQYPAGGPLPHLMDIWRAGAPQIDFLSPDIYFPNFAEWARKYQQSGNPVFIPEAAPNPASAINALYSFGQLDAIGFSPFAIESAEEPVNKLIAGSYDLLRQLSPLILEHQGKGEMAGFLPEGPEQRAPLKVKLNGFTLNISYDSPLLPPTTTQVSDAISGGLAVAVGRDEFVFAGRGLTITFEDAAAPDTAVGLLSVQEGKYVDGQWLPGRWLNGDQTHQGRHVRLGTGKFDIQRVKLYRYH
jgi:beta-galactosidase GanA